MLNCNFFRCSVKGTVCEVQVQYWGVEFNGRVLAMGYWCWV